LSRKCLHINEEIMYRKIFMGSKITYWSRMVFIKLCCEFGDRFRNLVMTVEGDQNYWDYCNDSNKSTLI